MQKLANEDNFGANLVDETNQTPRIPQPVKRTQNTQ